MKKVGLLLLILALMLVACGGDDEDDSGDDTSASPTIAPTTETAVTVNWIGHWLYEDLRETLVRETAQEFAFLNQDVSVNLQFPQEIMDVRSKPLMAEYIAEMIRSGNIEWDVLWMDDQIYQYVADELDDPRWGEQYLVDFEEVEGFTASQKPFIINDPIYREQTGGVLVGPYIEGYYHALYYNIDVAEQIGLDIEPVGMRFEDFLGYVQAVYEYNQANDANIAAIYEASDWPSRELLFQNLVKSLIPDFQEAIAEEMTDEKLAAMRRALEAFEQLGQYDPLIDSYPDNIWFDTRHLVLDGEALFYINGTWMYSHWRGIDEEKLSRMVPVELPAFEESDHYMGGYIPTWAVLQDAPNREAAIDLVMHWSTPGIAEKWVRYTKNPTGVAGNFSTAESGTDVFEEYMQNITAKYGANVHYSATSGYLLGAENTHLDRALQEELLLLLTGQTTADQAYERIVSQLEE